MNTNTLAGHGGIDSERTRRHANPLVTGAIWIGLALTVFATIFPYVDRANSNAMAAHIRAGYPTYGRHRVDTAVDIYLAYLTLLGVGGIAAWLATAWAIRAGRRWARAAATATFVLAVCLAVFDLVVKDTSGDTGLPLQIGVIGLVPCLPGLLVVTLLWIGEQP